MNILNIGRNALIGNKKALEITSNNISNANKEGYAKKDINFEDQLGLGGLGRVNVRRIVNNQHIEQMQNNKSEHAKNSTYLSNITNLNNSLTNYKFNLNNSIDNIYTSFREATTISEHTGAKKSVLENLKSFDQYMKQQDYNLSQEEKDINTRIQYKLKEANTYINNIAELNEKIAGLPENSEDSHSLLDEKDRLSNKLSEIIDFDEIKQENGFSNLYLKNGEPLILKNKTLNFKTTPNEFNQDLDIKLYSKENFNQEINVKENNIGGEVEGLLKYKNEDLKFAKNDINKIYSVFSEKMNSINSQGYDSNNNSGKNIFEINNEYYGKSSIKNKEQNEILMKLENNKEQNYNNSTYTINIKNDNGNSVSFELIEKTENNKEIKSNHTLNKDILNGESSGLPNGISLNLKSNKPYNNGDKFYFNPNENTIINSKININKEEELAFSKSNTSKDNENLISFIDSQFEKTSKNNNGQDGNPTLTFQESFGNLGTKIGSKSNLAESDFISSQVNLENSLEQVKDSSRVNIQEEIVNMERYQQSYEAAARIIEVSQNMFDVLMNHTR